MSKNPAARKQTTPPSLHSQGDVNESATDNNLDEILAEYFTWRGEAIHEVNQTQNYKRLKSAILTHYIKKSDVVDIVMGALLSEKVTITIPPQKLGEYQHIYQFSLSLKTLLITSGRLQEIEQALTTALKGKYSNGGSE